MVQDVDGNQYIDFNAGLIVNNVGSTNPEVVKAAISQSQKFIHYSYTDFFYENLLDLADKLCTITPGAFNKQVFYGNSGAEAIEAAFKLVRFHSKRPRTLAFSGSFHGRTMGALSLTSSKPVQVRGFSPLVPGVHHTPYPYCYRCPYEKEYPSCNFYCVDQIEEQLFERYVPPDEVAAMFIEPIQGEGGYIVPPEDYFHRLQKLLRLHGILLVDDEIQSGMGRTGRWFAIEHFGVEPEILCVAKALAGGFPLSATIADTKLMTWTSGSHASTFGGNPVSVAAAIATINYIEKERLLKNAEKQGHYLMKRLVEMKQRYEIVGDVRGKGLMIGVEIVKDRHSKQYGSEEANEIIQRSWNAGVLLITAGKSTVRIAPPLTIRREIIDEALEIIEEQIAAVNRKKR